MYTKAREATLGEKEGRMVKARTEHIKGKFVGNENQVWDLWGCVFVCPAAQ